MNGLISRERNGKERNGLFLTFLLLDKKKRKKEKEIKCFHFSLNPPNFRRKKMENRGY